MLFRSRTDTVQRWQRVQGSQALMQELACALRRSVRAALGILRRSFYARTRCLAIADNKTRCRAVGSTAAPSLSLLEGIRIQEICLDQRTVALQGEWSTTVVQKGQLLTPEEPQYVADTWSPWQAQGLHLLCRHAAHVLEWEAALRALEGGEEYQTALERVRRLCG